jgi:tRNA wybutosine-synthesizing protein 2
MYHRGCDVIAYRRIDSELIFCLLYIFDCRALPHWLESEVAGPDLYPIFNFISPSEYNHIIKWPRTWAKISMPYQKKPKKNSTNPLQHGIQQFLSQHPPTSTTTTTTTTEISLPKRYTIYSPLLLLPPNFFTYPSSWAAHYASLSDAQRGELYAAVAAAFAHVGVTHIALNAPILLTDSAGAENRMRSPANLVPLYGDFGPLSNGAEQKDFEGALWVQTAQNGGIVQCWAPLYTMFSRGNVTEKARILGHDERRFAGLDEASLNGQSVREIGVVDLYAGIGYFIFSYLRRGVKRVWGWEINGWSVEGLRRGCVLNGWGCRVIPLDVGSDVNGIVEELRDLAETDRVVVFQGDNRTAPAILEALQPILERRGGWAPIRHVNLGLLPTSRPTWEASLRVLDRAAGGWTHVHENVDVAGIESKKGDIVAEYQDLAASLYQERKTLITCDHVEQVKTYAPGVMHCVYDIQVDFNHSTSMIPK